MTLPMYGRFRHVAAMNRQPSFIAAPNAATQQDYMVSQEKQGAIFLTLENYRPIGCISKTLIFSYLEKFSKILLQKSIIQKPSKFKKRWQKDEESFYDRFRRSFPEAC